jgi:hypothetical protein
VVAQIIREHCSYLVKSTMDDELPESEQRNPREQLLKVRRRQHVSKKHESF